jgi:hypothetical protein
LNRQQRARRTACLAVVLAAVAAVLFSNHQTGPGLEALAVSAGIVTYLLAFQLPVKCGIQTTKSRPCQNDANGLLFGCSRYHHWVKFRARLGLLPRPAAKNGRVTVPAVPTAAAPAVTIAAVEQDGGDRVEIAESGREKAGTWIAASTLLGTIVCAVTGVIAVVPH